MTRFRATDQVVTEDALKGIICWDDDEDKDATLKPGVYQTCAGAWVREEDGRWRWHQDPDWES